ncbi:MAG: hypothetical protein HY319_07120 [Armatimonadetes bacterium]|nr:hypothetical protein [Armatimonadota bacterium]
MEVVRASGSGIRRKLARPVALKTEQHEEQPTSRLSPELLARIRRQDSPKPEEIRPTVAALPSAAEKRPASKLEEALETLKAAHYRFGDGQAESIETSFREGYEALVRFEHEFDSVASFHSPDEVVAYAAMASARAVEPELAPLRQSFRELEQKGSLFYFARGAEPLVQGLPLRQKSGWIRTDALGASLVLRRGEAVRHLAADGQLELLETPEQLKAAARRLEDNPPPAERLEAISLMNRISSLGMSIEPSLGDPPDILMTDYDKSYQHELKTRLRSAFGEELAQSLPLQHKKLIDDLASGEYVQFLKDGDYPFYPLHVNRGQLKTLERYRTDATPEMVTFDRAWKRLLSDQGLLFARIQGGEGKGALVRTDSLGAYLTLANDGVVVVLDARGDLKTCSTVDDVLRAIYPPHGLEQYRAKATPSSGAATGPAPETPASQENLFAIYYNALHDSEGKYPYYDDFPVKLQSMGSTPGVEVVVERSDRPVKRHLRRDILEEGRLGSLVELPAEKLMSDPRELEDFVYQTVKQHGDHKHLRLMVVGHGGADRGLLDDYRQDGTLTQMPVDKFADAISQALDRVEKETGKRPVIDNLIMGSCLMGTASLVSALAEHGDVRFLSASPEVLLDGFPRAMLEYLREHPDAGAEEFASALVEINMAAVSLEGGKENRKHALVYGAYSLEPEKNREFKGALKEFFAACSEHPEYAAYYRQDVQRVPSYNIHPAGGPGPGENQRDLLAVVRAIRDDGRIRSDRIEEAADRLTRAARAQVVRQEGIGRHADREGLSLHLPLHNGNKAPTRLLDETGWEKFMGLIVRAPNRWKAQEVLAYELYRARGDAMVAMAEDAQPLERERDAAAEQQWLTKQELPLPDSSLGGRTTAILRTGLQVGAAVVGGTVGAALGAAVGGAAGTLLGLRAGLTGCSLAQASRGRPVPASPEARAPRTVFEVMQRNPRITDPLLLLPMEYAGSELHDAIARRAGVGLAAAVGGPVGAVAGLAGGLLTGTLVGGLGGAQQGLAVVEDLLPSKPPRPSLAAIEPESPSTAKPAGPPA